MRIIEFVGLPGCGKSTIIDIEKTALNRKFVTREELFSIPIPRNWLPQYFIKAYLKVILFAHNTVTKSSNSIKYQYRLIELIIHLYYYKARIDSCMLLLEEGVVQYISSLSFDSELMIDLFLKSLITLLFRTFDIIIVKCAISVDESSARIIKRCKDGDRYCIADESKRHMLLQTKRKNLDTILNSVNANIYELDMMKKPVENALVLSRVLEENSCVSYNGGKDVKLG